MKHIQSIARSILMRFDGILSSNIRDIRSDTSSLVLCSKFLDWRDITPSLFQSSDSREAKQAQVQMKGI